MKLLKDIISKEHSIGLWQSINYIRLYFWRGDKNTCERLEECIRRLDSRETLNKLCDFLESSLCAS